MTILQKSRTLLIGMAVMIMILQSASAGQYEEYLNHPVVPGLVPASSGMSTDLNSGAAMFTYEIEVPPGTNGLQPQLTLRYNSHMRNSYPGFVGSGWQLSETYIQRNANHTPENQNDDWYTLIFYGDSHKLVYDPGDGKYHTNPETFLSVKKIATQNNPAGWYWEVRTKDGTSYRLGATGNSELHSNQFDYGWKWYLDRIEDTNGNTIIYMYKDGYGGVKYMDSIVYNNDGRRRVKFRYEAYLDQYGNPMAWVIFDNGQRIHNFNRIQRIQTYSDDELVKEYIINYTANDVRTRSYISSITVAGKDGAQLPPTLFSYMQPETRWERDQELEARLPPVWLSLDQHDSGTRLADLNRDGRVDFMMNSWADFRNPEAYISKGSYYVRNETYAPPDEAYFIDGDSSGVYDVGVRIGDYDSDGYPDLIKSMIYYPHGRFDDDGLEVLYDVWLNKEGDWEHNSPEFIPHVIRHERIDGATPYSTDLGVRFVDLNGDRYDDVVEASHGRYEFRTWVNRNGQFIRNYEWTIPGDIAFAEEDGDDTGARLIDMNGDGLVDFYVSPFFGEKKVWLNTGSGWEEDTLMAMGGIPENVDRNDNDAGVRLADINSDGLVDVVLAKGSQRQTYLNQGDRWIPDQTWDLPQGAEFVLEDGGHGGTVLTDINHDGTADIVTLRETTDSNPPVQRVWLNRYAQQSLLKEVTFPEGGKAYINYTSSGEVDSNKIGMALWTVASITYQSGMPDHQEEQTTWYRYGGGKYDFEDDEFLGFQSVTQTLPDGTRISRMYHQTNGLYGKEYQIEWHDSNDKLFQQEQFNWSSEERNEYVVNHLLMREKKEHFPPGQSNPSRITRTEYSYDDYGNIETLHYHGLTSNDNDGWSEQFEYVYNPQEWIVDTVKNHRILDSGGDIVREEWFYYDDQGLDDPPAKADLTKHEIWLDNGENPQTAFAYDDHGNIVEKIGPIGYLTNYGYDATSTFQTGVNNSLGQTATFTYDLGTGNILSKRDNNGYETRYEYDGLGRIIKEIRPYDNTNQPTEEYEYDYSGSAPSAITIFKREESGHDNVFTSVSFYDGFGNLIQAKEERENNKEMVVNLFYDAAGRLTRISNPTLHQRAEAYTPLLPADEEYITALTYTPSGKLTKVTNPDGTTKKIMHSSEGITVYNENGNRKDYVLDGNNNIIKVREFMGDAVFETTYEYDSLGSILSITDDQENRIRYNYNSLGRKIYSESPDLGIWAYEYDADGNLKNRTDANGNTVSFFYDALGRMVSQLSGDDVVTYTYDKEVVGTLSEVETSAAIISYLYDERLRTIQARYRYDDGTSVLIEYQYDALGRIVQETNPAHTVTYVYGEGGLIKEIEGFISDVKYDKFGLASERTYENGQRTTIRRDLSIPRITLLQTSDLQDLFYRYDNLSNVITINDRSNVRLKTMEYDALQRLTHADEIGPEDIGYTYDYAYDYAGNMLSIRSLDQNIEFVYDSEKPAHAPRAVEIS